MTECTATVRKVEPYLGEFIAEYRPTKVDYFSKDCSLNDKLKAGDRVWYTASFPGTHGVVLDARKDGLCHFRYEGGSTGYPPASKLRLMRLECKTRNIKTAHVVQVHLGD